MDIIMISAYAQSNIESHRQASECFTLLLLFEWDYPSVHAQLQHYLVILQAVNA